MIVEYISPAGNGFIGRINIREMQAYNKWIKGHGYYFNGRSWVWAQ